MNLCVIKAMTRSEKLLAHLRVQGPGLEIGPSHSPVAPKNAGYKVRTLDTLSREQLAAKYQAQGIDTKRIEEVDYIWRGERYADLLGPEARVDWIIASHVVEHTPDLIGFLSHCSEILEANGALALAVPDKRFCFDRFRPLSGLSGVIDAHFQKRTRHTVGSVVEFIFNAITRNGQIAWSKDEAGEVKNICTVDDALAHLRASTDGSSAEDVHAWCFTPSSFRLMMLDLYLMGLTDLREIAFYPTEGHEFFSILGRNAAPSSLSRRDLQIAVEQELAECANI
jgi:predicted SAM-dependent methyltransferase